MNVYAYIHGYIRERTKVKSSIQTAICAIDLQCGRSIPCHATEVRFQCCPDDVAPGSGLSLVFRTVAIMFVRNATKGRSRKIWLSALGSSALARCLSARSRARNGGIVVLEIPQIFAIHAVKHAGFDGRGCRERGPAEILAALLRHWTSIRVGFASNSACDFEL
jgi:hypothetical protein